MFTSGDDCNCNQVNCLLNHVLEQNNSIMINENLPFPLKIYLRDFSNNEESVNDGVEFNLFIVYFYKS